MNSSLSTSSGLVNHPDSVGSRGSGEPAASQVDASPVAASQVGLSQVTEVVAATDDETLETDAPPPRLDSAANAESGPGRTRQPRRRRVPGKGDQDRA